MTALGLNHFGVAAPLAGKQAVGGQLLHDAVQIDSGKIDFVQRHDDRHPGRPGVAEGFLCLGHHTVVGGHHQHGDIGDHRPASPHRRERLVTRGIDECDRPDVLLDPVSPDVLGNAPLFVRGDVEP